MRFSVNYPIVQHPLPDELVGKDALVTFARTAERLGFDGIGVTEHPAPSHKWLEGGGHDAFDPYVALAVVAAVTERVRLVPNVLVLPYRNPFLTAKAVATIDALSDGRFTLAVATGYLRSEYRALGVDFDRRNDLFDEALAVVRAALGHDEVAHDGLGFTATGVTANPKPRRPVPVWIGGNSGRARQRVADGADGWCPFFAPAVLSGTARTAPLDSADALATVLDDLWRRCDEAGRDRAGIDVEFGLPVRGTPGSGSFDVDGHREDLAALTALGVTWTRVGVPGHSLAAALEGLEDYAANVIAPLRG